MEMALEAVNMICFTIIFSPNSILCASKTTT